ncbi:glycosyltransferase [Marichromatium bheemlicum]|uniref:Glycosyltransferase n=2 Tax=Marichromatium bheemlicum TaxID=365339 RepID=A0ABX1IBA1_9GAMM|nr:glycosyltransferase [Marichromatium bheemlicum]
MPCYNAERFVAAAVDSVLGQGYRQVELIVVDDGSSDGSIEILRGYGERLRLLTQRNQGPYVARNHGLQAARGAYVAFLDADDWWREDCLERLQTALAACPSCVLAYCGWQSVGLPGRRGEPFVPPDYEAEDKAARFLRGAAPWPIHAALVRRAPLVAAGGFRLDLPTCMDYDLWLRLGVSQRIVRVPEVMAFYRHHDGGQITAQQWRQARNSWLVKRGFVRRAPQAVAHLSRAERRALIDGGLLRRGYDNFWRRDLVSAQRIFRRALFTRAWGGGDLKYLLPAWLPAPVFQWLVGARDR